MAYARIGPSAVRHAGRGKFDVLDRSPPRASKRHIPTVRLTATSSGSRKNCSSVGNLWGSGVIQWD
jgi:hypothetical protein